MSEGFPIPRRQPNLCPDCAVELQAIRLLDATTLGFSGNGSGQVPLSYAAVDSESGFFGSISPLGNIDARICPECGRIQLYGHVAPERTSRRLRRTDLVEPPPAQPTPPLSADGLPPIDPPQPLPQPRHADPQPWQTEAEPLALAAERQSSAEPGPTHYEWGVQAADSVVERFTTEKEAEAFARQRVNVNPEERLVVVGPGRRYRVLP